MPKKKPFLKFKNTEGIEYEFYYRAPHPTYRANGICDSPETDNPKVYVDPNLKERKKLKVLIEEIFHSMFFEKTEREAKLFASTLANILEKSGWRLADE